MKFYQDITILPDAEMTIGFILQKVYGKLHLALVEMKSVSGYSHIGVSFPEYKSNGFPVGSKLRLFSVDKLKLQQLDITERLKNLMDYTHCTSIKEVPEQVDRYACFRRVQFSTSVKRLARRRSIRKNELYEEAIKHFSDFKGQESALPYVNICSASSDKKFRLFIKQDIVDQEVSGEFSCYGLSKTATVPLF